MFKKLFSILLTAIMILGMVGCGSTEDAAADTDASCASQWNHDSSPCAPQWDQDTAHQRNHDAPP